MVSDALMPSSAMLSTHDGNQTDQLSHSAQAGQSLLHEPTGTVAQTSLEFKFCPALQIVMSEPTRSLHSQ